MDNPAADISEVVVGLTKGSPKTQEHTLNHYFLPNASFKHPFCSVHGNRDAILRIFQWYKIMSPHIEVTINSVGMSMAFDEKNLILYVNISQVFKIFFIPFYRAPVTLTTVLQLVHGPNLKRGTGSSDPLRPRKYYIQSQNDLYQVDQFVRFALPWGIGSTLVLIYHWFATLCCILGARIFAPLRWNNQVLADAQPVYPDVPQHHTHRNNASEILEFHGRANEPRSVEVGIAHETAESDWQATLQQVASNEESLRELQRRRPGSQRSI